MAITLTTPAPKTRTDEVRAVCAKIDEQAAAVIRTCERQIAELLAIRRGAVAR